MMGAGFLPVPIFFDTSSAFKDTGYCGPICRIQTSMIGRAFLSALKFSARHHVVQFFGAHAFAGAGS